MHKHVLNYFFANESDEKNTNWCKSDENQSTNQLDEWGIRGQDKEKMSLTLIC